MGLGCFVGAHDQWTGWDQMAGSLWHPVRWVRRCLSCGESEWRERPPRGWCGSIEDDHDWEGSLVFPLIRTGPIPDGGRRKEYYKRCRRCLAEHLFFTASLESQ